MMHIEAGIDALDIVDLIADSKRRITLHAAVYGPFAQSQPHCNAFAKALQKPHFKRLDIITLQHEQPWTASFLEALRFGSTPKEQGDAVASSMAFIQKLQDLQPQRVHVHPLMTFPCLPILIIDDTVVFGQYAHCAIHAARGAWGVIETDVQKIQAWAEVDIIPPNATSEEVAAYRLIAECRHAMNGGRR